MISKLTPRGALILKLRGWRGRLFLAIIALLLAMGFWLWQVGGASGFSQGLMKGFFTLAGWTDRSLPGILELHIPLMGEIISQNVVAAGRDKPDDLRGYLGGVIGARIREPVSFLTSQIPLMAKYNIEQSRVGENQPIVPDNQANPEKKVETPPVKLNLGDKPLVLIYSSHTGETYEATDGLSRLSGKRGGVYQAAAELAGRLEKVYGIKVIHSPEIFDTDYRGGLPYLRSAQMVAKVLKENPSIQLVIDVHRDGNVSRENSITEIQGEKTARIMLVVGTNARSTHPNWMQNYAFAKSVAAKAKAMYPNFLRKVEAQRGRYNQHLHPRAILVEIGSDKNSLEEALVAARLVADVLARELEELKF
ncbi:MAG: stage II sporulation protein P [Thermincolia bacterium]